MRRTVRDSGCVLFTYSRNEIHFWGGVVDRTVDGNTRYDPVRIRGVSRNSQIFALGSVVKFFRDYRDADGSKLYVL
jgi:hypothetical protein